MSCKTITISNHKGGVGKSTISNAIISELARSGKKVLIIDADKLGITSTMYGKNGESVTTSMLLNSNIIEPIKCTENIYIIVADSLIGQMENIGNKNLLNGINKNHFADKFDYIFIDPPGSWSAVTRNSLRCADLVIIPGKPSELEVKPIHDMIAEMSNIDLPQEPEIFVILNEWDISKNQNGILEAYQNLDEEYGEGTFCKNIITSQKTYKNLTDDIYNYKLWGNAKRQINDLMVGVGVL